MEEKQCLIITLPPHLADLPIQIVRGSDDKELNYCLEPIGEQVKISNEEENKFVFVLYQDKYVKVEFDEILCINASGSNSEMHLSNDRTLVIPSHLSLIESQLPNNHFFRTHRSSIVNLKHVTSFIGNILNIGKISIPIGRAYREPLFDRFIFLGAKPK